MAIDFNFLQQNAPKQEEPKQEPKSGNANVSIRIDADAMMQCDGEYIDVQFQAGVITKVELPIGQHLLEFFSVENPNIKVEKVVDFVEAGKNYLVLVNELKAAIAPPMPKEAKPNIPPTNVFLDRLNQIAQCQNPSTYVPPMPHLPQPPSFQQMPPMPTNNEKQ